MNADNPYRSPIDLQPGKYDHSLFWKFVKAMWIVAIIIGLGDTILIIQQPRYLNDSNSPRTVLHGLVGDLVEDPRRTAERIRQEAAEATLEHHNSGTSVR